MNNINLITLLSCWALVITSLLPAQTIWTVNTIDDADDGSCNAAHCSLREAINGVNNNGGNNLIAFEIAGNSPFVIEPVTPLPRITTDETTIDGTTQPNFRQGDITIQATNTTSNSSGLSIAAGDIAVYGLKVVGFSENNSAGIEILSTQLLTNIQIGAPNKGNIVGDNHHGILFRQITNCADVRIQSNYVGVDPANGMSDIGNNHTGIGILQGNCTNVLIGGNSNNGEGNIVGFNNGGIRTRIPQTVIQGNFIGTDESGTMNLGNLFNGILLDDLPGEPNNCLVGGPADGQSNVIAFNGSIGIFNNPTAINNRFQRNSIYCNREGIRYGFTSQDDNRSNEGQEPPIIDCVFRSNIIGTAEPNNIIEVFSNDDSACNGFRCQGKTFLGETMSDDAGNWQLTVSLTNGESITATATDPSLNTSMFSSCAIVAGQLTATATNTGPYCLGQSVQLNGQLTGGTATQFSWTGPNGYTANQQNPRDATEAGIYQFTATSNGCQITSTTTEVAFLATITRTIAETLCPTQSISINGQTYDTNNPTGSEMLAGQAGCDTLITIDLQFHPKNEFQLSQTLCAGEGVLINGTRYDANRPQGMETIVGGANSGCDSVVTIDLDFYDVIDVNYSPTFCTGTAININGTSYDENNPTGVEIFQGGSANGCDSTVQIQLSFADNAIGQLTPAICRGDTYEYLGTIYNENNPNGSHLLTIQSSTGCDSVVEVRLQFLEPQIQAVTDTYCAGDTIMINGQLYHETQATGREILPITASNGCDSILDIQLNFLQPIREQLILNLCPDESQTVNGIIYNANNLSGQEVFVGATLLGCDSTVDVQIVMLDIPSGQLSESLCEGEFLEVNGTTYDVNNPIGMERFDGASANGCDSILAINLQFKPTISTFLDTTLCAGESISFDGTIYNESRPQGMELIEQVDVCENRLIELTYPEAISGSISGDENLRLGDSLTLTLNLSGANLFDVTLDIGAPSPMILTNIGDGHTLVFNPRQTTTYQILALNPVNQIECNPIIGDALTVFVVQNKAIYFPTAFSPNGDGVNDVFLPLSDDQVTEILSFRVFDRWGNLLYHRANFTPNNSGAAWDGTYQGKQLENDVFLYSAEVVFGDEKREVFSGDIMLLRD